MRSTFSVFAVLLVALIASACTSEQFREFGSGIRGEIGQTDGSLSNVHGPTRLTSESTYLGLSFGIPLCAPPVRHVVIDNLPTVQVGEATALATVPIGPMTIATPHQFRFDELTGVQRCTICEKSREEAACEHAQPWHARGLAPDAVRPAESQPQSHVPPTGSEPAREVPP